MIFRRIINYSNIYIFGLMVLAAMLPWSEYVMSVAQFILIGNWFLLGENPIQKCKKFFRNKPALIFTSIFLLHLLGLIYTSDFDYAFNDIRKKLPLIVLPLILSTSESLDKKRFFLVLFPFIASVVLETVYSTYLYFTKDFIDIRELSPFISHIRFSLMVCLSVFILGYFVLAENVFSVIHKIFFSLIICWLITFLFLLESMTGLGILIITTFILFLYFIFSRKMQIRPGFRIILISLIIMIPIGSLIYVKRIIKELNYVNPVEFKKLEQKTKLGNIYFHDTINRQTENGNIIWIYVCPKELEEAWNKRSKIDYNKKDLKDQDIANTLIRFLASKGYHKDAEGMNKLTNTEVHLIEKGISNFKYEDKFNIRSKIAQTIWALNIYNKYENPNGNTFTQRLEYWKASLGIIKKNLLIGVGTGDVDVAFKKYYQETKSVLAPELRFRSHNQFLAIFVGFGIIGFVWFLIGLFYPPFFLKQFFNYYFFVFFIIAFLSMLTEDTLETQAGVTFFAFFYCLFLFGRKEVENII